MNNYNLEQDVFNWLEAAGLERGDETMQETAISLFFEELKELYLGIVKTDKEEQLDGAVDTLWIIGNCNYFMVEDSIVQSFLELRDKALNFCYFDAAQFLRYASAVSISNWSKFCESEAEALDTVNAYQFGTHPDKSGKSIKADAKEVGDKWVIFDSATRKVLKSINYKPVQEVLKTM